jgi:hypothetical protein
MSEQNQCPICGADLLHMNKDMCKNFHQQPAPETERMYLISESELECAHAGLAFKSYLYIDHDAAIRKEERETVLDKLSETMFCEQSRTFLKDTYRMHIDWYEVIQSLRKGAP